MPRKCGRERVNGTVVEREKGFYLGLDLSLTGTGICVIDEQGIVHVTQTLKTKLKGFERLQFIRKSTLAIIEVFKPIFTCIEGYSMGSRAGQAFSIGELGGIIKYSLWGRGVPFKDVAPTQVKKFGTGKGNCAKDEIMMKVYKEYGFEAKDNNCADSFVLAQIARAWKSSVTLRKHQAEVIITLREKENVE